LTGVTNEDGKKDWILLLTKCVPAIPVEQGRMVNWHQ